MAQELELRSALVEVRRKREMTSGSHTHPDKYLGDAWRTVRRSREDCLRGRCYSHGRRRVGDRVAVRRRVRGDPVDNARRYNQAAIDHVRRGTPKRPGVLETYVFAMLNENQKPGDPTEKNFGLFYPDMQPVYPITFPN